MTRHSDKPLKIADRGGRVPTPERAPLILAFAALAVAGGFERLHDATHLQPYLWASATSLATVAASCVWYLAALWRLYRW